MNIYVGNLSRQAGEIELRKLFSEFGEVKSVKIIKDNLSGESRGFAFVEMANDEAGNVAIKSLDSKEFENRKLKINEAKPKNTAAKVYNSFSSNFGYKDRHSNFWGLIQIIVIIWRLREDPKPDWTETEMPV